MALNSPALSIVSSFALKSNPDAPDVAYSGSGLLDSLTKLTLNLIKLKSFLSI